MIISTSSHNILLLADYVISVDVFLKAVNGPKGGVDKQVVMRVHLRNRKHLVVETAHESLQAAVRLGAKCAKRAVRRSLRKSRRIEKYRMHKHFAGRAVPWSANA